MAKAPKPGQILYEVMHEDNGKPLIEEWHIRTVRGGKATAIWKLAHTWGKRSKKHGDFGWLDPIPAWCRRTWKIETGPSPWWGMFPTKAAAIRHALSTADPRDFDEPEEFERYTSGLKRMRP